MSILDMCPLREPESTVFWWGCLHHTEFIVEVLLKNVGVEFFTSFAAKSDSQFMSYAVLKLK